MVYMRRSTTLIRTLLERFSDGSSNIESLRFQLSAICCQVASVAVSAKINTSKDAIH